MTPLRQRMLDAMELHGLAVRTREAYIDAVARLGVGHRDVIRLRYFDGLSLRRIGSRACSPATKCVSGVSSAARCRRVAAGISNSSPKYSKTSRGVSR